MKKGLYRHFKGDYYFVEGTASDSETLEEMVIYKPVLGDRVWVRSRKAFEERVVGSIIGNVERFAYISAKNVKVVLNTNAGKDKEFVATPILEWETPETGERHEEKLRIR